jgi:hypothetical protein
LPTPYALSSASTLNGLMISICAAVYRGDDQFILQWQRQTSNSRVFLL